MLTRTQNQYRSGLEALEWRYATKQFNPERTLSDETLETLLEAVRLSPSSYGLQPYHIFVIRDAAVREELRKAAWNQSQLTDASHVLVFANLTDFGPELIDDYISLVARERKTDRENLKGYADFMKSKLLELPQETKDNWTARQAYIALGNLLYAAAELGVDTCPMEGFDNQAVNKILGLEAQGLNAAVIATVGYRSEDDVTQHYPKVRKSHETLFTHL